MLSGLYGLSRTGYFGHGRQIQSGTSGALTAIGTKISLAHEVNPTKHNGTDKMLPCLARMMVGCHKQDSPTEKKLPVEVDVPELLVWLAMMEGASGVIKATGDWVLIAFYYLLRIGEYIVQNTHNNTKQTVQFKMEDITFFRKNAMGQLRQLKRQASEGEIMTADSATLDVAWMADE